MSERTSVQRAKRNQQRKRQRASWREGLMPKKPPEFKLGQRVVFRFYEDGRHWTVEDAQLALPWLPKPRKKTRSKYPAWRYTLTGIRESDGAPVTTSAYQWWLKPSPTEVP